MSAPVRFLAVAVFGWMAIRAGTLGAMPGFTISPAQAAPPPIVPTELSPFAAAPWPQEDDYGQPQQWVEPPSFQRLQFQPVRIPIPYYVPASSSPAPPQLAALTPRPAWSLEDYGYSLLPPLAGGAPAAQSAPAPAAVTPAVRKLDRWQLSSWALLRGAPTPGTLASGGTLGGSQAGARLLYLFNRSLAASVRTTSPIGGSTGAEVAAGLRWAPLRSLPVAFTVERRQSISRFGGRSDFAFFAEGGLYRQPMPWQFELDAYLQAGVVGLQERDMFADGSLAFTRPVLGKVSAGFGAWGGYQPGLYRVDAGPRVTVKVRENVRAHIDYRQRIAGGAQPASGPTLTLAADF